MIEELKKFGPQYKLPQAAVLGAPFIAQHFATSALIWPPLGGLETYSAFAATVVIGLCSLLPGLIETKQRAKAWLKVAIALAFTMFIVYSVLVGRFVISVETPENGVQIRSIGFRVEPRIREMFPGKNDSELLRIGGLEEWQIEKIWTPNSVLALRICLLTSFAMTFGMANLAIGAAAKINKEKT